MPLVCGLGCRSWLLSWWKWAEGTDPVAARNASLFLLSLANRRDPSIRAIVVKGFLDPKAANDVHAENIAMLITSDPSLLQLLSPATRMRVEALLLKNPNTLGTGVPFTELRNPAHVLGSCISVLGETFMVTHYKAFVDWVIDRVPYSPEFVSTLKASPTLLTKLPALIARITPMLPTSWGHLLWPGDAMAPWATRDVPAVLSDIGCLTPGTRTPG
jgi:hypothetical protein